MTIQMKEKQEITKPVVIADGTYMFRDGHETTFIEIKKLHYKKTVLWFDCNFSPRNYDISGRYVNTVLELSSKLVSNLIPCDPEEAKAVIDEFLRLHELVQEVAA